ncbi:MAG: tetratricopeptide repeat protein [Nitrospirae bacterium]|nr:MAG: tetratricopeptide repeat protein [Nitrospirota bacterium]
MGEEPLTGAKARLAVLLEQDDIAAARRLIEAHAAAWPNLPEELLRLAHHAFAQGLAEEAVECLRVGVRHCPRDFNLWLYLAETLLATGRNSEAVSALRKALRLSGNRSPEDGRLAQALERAGLFPEAVLIRRRLVKRNPRSIQLWIDLARALIRAEGFKEAHTVLKQVLRLDPSNLQAQYYMGVLMRETARPEEAVKWFEACAQSSPRHVEIWYNLGNALAESGRMTEAEAAYEEALRRNFDYVPAHDSLARLRWQMGAKKRFLASYEARHRRPPPPPEAFYLSYAQKLTLTKRFDEGRTLLEEALRRYPASGYLAAARARLEDEAGAHDEAAEWHARAVAQLPHDVELALFQAWNLLVRGEAEKAQDLLLGLRKNAPNHQFLYALLALAWRELDDPRAATLLDYQRFVKRYTIPLPDGYQSLSAFLEELAVCLDRLHQTRRHPLDQTLRGGSQTLDFLFRRPDPVIQALRQTISRCVARYIAALPKDPDHPLCARKSGKFRFAGSWSVRLQNAGYHVSHIHPAGWISSAFYVRVPPTIRRNDPERQGWLEFGEPEPPLPRRVPAAHAECPEEGVLVLFPSYLWHGTRPFHSTQTRMTVAFDVIPIRSM